MLNILGVVLLWTTWFRTSQIASRVGAKWMEVWHLILVSKLREWPEGSGGFIVILNKLSQTSL